MILADDFIKQIQDKLGENSSLFLESLNHEVPTSIRVNKLKNNPTLDLEKVLWSNFGYYLKKTHSFVLDPLWHIGKYYVQEASSMSLEMAFLEIKKQTGNTPLKILDLCAAPGGKSTYITQLMNENDVLVSNEIDKSRVKILKENIRKNGHHQCVVTNKSSDDFGNLGEYFDVVIIDAPCSGEGMFRKDPQALEHWSLNNVNLCVERQNNILNNASNCLKENGYLIYSTCTFNEEENEKQIQKLIHSGYEPIEFELNNNCDFQHRFWFHLKKGEGFYLALLQKRKSDVKAKELKLRINFEKISEPILKDMEKFIFSKNKFKIEAITEEIINLYKYLPFEPEISGIETHQIKNLFVGYSSYLPFAAAYNSKYLEPILLNENQVLDYFKGNAVNNEFKQNGWVNLVFNGHILGIGKAVNQRINNHFPTEWQIKKNILKEDRVGLLY